MDTASSDDIEITRMVYTPVVVSMHRGVSLPPISPVRPEYQSASPQMVPFSPGVVGLPPASASNASLSIAPQDARGDTVLVPVSSPRALPLPGDTHMPGPRASTPSIGYLAREPGGCVVGTSETDTSDALEDTRPGSSSTTKSSVFEVDAADLSRDFQPLVNGLAHVKGYVHFHILFYNLRAFPGVPKDLRTFDCWIQVAETLGLVARIGDEICLQQMSDGYKTQSTFYLVTPKGYRLISLKVPSPAIPRLRHLLPFLTTRVQRWRSYLQKCQIASLRWPISLSGRSLLAMCVLGAPLFLPCSVKPLLRGLLRLGG
jgi:hypothetical protein